MILLVSSEECRQTHESLDPFGAPDVAKTMLHIYDLPNVSDYDG